MHCHRVEVVSMAVVLQLPQSLFVSVVVVLVVANLQVLASPLVAFVVVW